MKYVTMEQPDHDECGIEVKQELEEDPLAGQLKFDTTLWTYEVLPIYLLVNLSLMMSFFIYLIWFVETYPPNQAMTKNLCSIMQSIYASIRTVDV